VLHFPATTEVTFVIRSILFRQLFSKSEIYSHCLVGGEERLMLDCQKAGEIIRLEVDGGCRVASMSVIVVCYDV
jgi:hypothetical protein